MQILQNSKCLEDLNKNNSKQLTATTISAYLMHFYDHRVGTDTPGPGEAAFAIRFSGKLNDCLSNL